MENRKPQTPVVAKRRRPLLWVVALGCLILVAFFFLQLPARLSAPGASGFDATETQTLSQGTPATQATAISPADNLQQGAMIIDDPAASETRDALASLPSGPSDGTASSPTDPAASSASGHKARQSRSASPSSARRRSSRAAASKSAETDLLSALMRIIKQDEEAGAKQPQSMDSLIAQIQAEDERTQRENSAALASLGGTGDTQKESRSPSVQQKLRACPRANTVAGIECRSKICAQHAGEDVACPRQ